LDPAAQFKSLYNLLLGLSQIAFINACLMCLKKTERESNKLQRTKRMLKFHALYKAYFSMNQQILFCRKKLETAFRHNAFTQRRFNLLIWKPRQTAAASLLLVQLILKSKIFSTLLWHEVKSKYILNYFQTLIFSNTNK
jgi:hypothetical protein